MCVWGGGGGGGWGGREIGSRKLNGEEREKKGRLDEGEQQFTHGTGNGMQFEPRT